HDGGATAVVLLPDSPGGRKTTIFFIVCVEELWQGGTASCSPAIEIPDSPAGCMDPFVGVIVTTGILIFEGNAEDDFRIAGDILLEVVRVIGCQCKTAAVDHLVHLIDGFAV